MITDAEVEVVLRRSWEYIVAVMDIIFLSFHLQVDHYLHAGFRERLGGYVVEIAKETDWASVVHQDPFIVARLKELEDQIKGLEEQLRTVQSVCPWF